MRIRILKTRNVEKQRGVTLGREFETCDPPEDRAKHGTWIVDDTAQPVRLWPDEFEEIGDYGNKG